MKETSKIIYRRGREILAETTYTLTLNEIERLCRDYMDSTLRGIVTDPESSHNYLDSQLNQITA